MLTLIATPQQASVCLSCSHPAIRQCTYPHDWKFELHGNMTTLLGKPTQVSPPVSCPKKSSGCSVSRGISKSVGWSISGTTGISLRAINFGGGYSYSESTDVGVTCSCSLNTGQTECCSWEQEYVMFAVMATFKPKAGHCESSHLDTKPKGPFTVTASRTSSDGTASGRCGFLNTGCSDSY